jgi:hypothetical protein
MKIMAQGRLATYEEVNSFDRGSQRCLIIVNTGGKCIQQYFFLLPSSRSSIAFSLHWLSVASFSQIKMYPESQSVIVYNKPRVTLHDRDVSKWLTFSK